ncbi:hypothetical protein [Treponema pedis]|uniref:hypothetical protein n=1 Tax=Treponema pedis TaxID=409322 RepID=UPI002091C294|nr:hypothetical protein [Treponema pedis]
MKIMFIISVMNRFGKLVYIYIIFIFIILTGGSFALGKMLAYTQNIKQSELFADFNPALPSRILDIRGDLITEFSMDEKKGPYKLRRYFTFVDTSSVGA